MSDGYFGYSEWYRNLPIKWLFQNTNALKYWNAIGNTFNDTGADFKNATKISFPQYSPQDQRALGFVGHEYNVIQGPSDLELNTTFAARIKEWQYLDFMGTAFGILLQLYYQGYNDGYIIQQNGNIFGLTNLPARTDGYITLLNPRGEDDTDLTYYLNLTGSFDDNTGFDVIKAGLNENITSPFQRYTDAMLEPVPWWTFDLSPEGSFENGALEGTTAGDQDLDGYGRKYEGTSRFALLFMDGYDGPQTSTQALIINNIVNNWKSAKSGFIGTFVNGTIELPSSTVLGFPPRIVGAGNVLGFSSVNFIPGNTNIYFSGGE